MRAHYKKKLELRRLHEESDVPDGDEKEARRMKRKFDADKLKIEE
jgi:hypothetical protein